MHRCRPMIDVLTSLAIVVCLTLRPTTADVHTIQYATYDAATSPLGPWTPAELNPNWNDANVTETAWCVQNNPLTDEADDNDQVGRADDKCLLLRVFQPIGHANGTSLANTIAATTTGNESAAPSLLPVMLWIHGGMYLLGSGASEDLYHGESLATKESIVVVSINYRLGAHGFLGYRGAYGDTANVGTLDQKLAIEWTHGNIAAFGGDPNRITLAGESAGATSTSVHMANAQTNRLLAGAILESNPAGINLKSSEHQTKLFRKLAKKMGCRSTKSADDGGSTDDEDDDGVVVVVGDDDEDDLTDVAVKWGQSDEQIMDCLVQSSKAAGGMAKIVKASSGVTYVNSLVNLDAWMAFYTWAPSVDNVYVLGQPNKEALTAWPASKPVLVGTNEDEARFFIGMVCTILEAVAGQIPFGGAVLKCDGGELYDRALYKALMLVAYGRDTFKIDEYYQYQAHSPDPSFDDATEQFASLVTDSVFTCPNHDMAVAVSRGNTYFYRYAVDAICSVATNLEHCVGFSCHGDEIATVFGTYAVPSVSDRGNCTPEKVAQLQPFVDAIQNQWGHFIREGVPDSSTANWAAVDRTSDGDVRVFRFEQTETGGDPTGSEALFTTHHTKQESYTAQEVCETWSTHTYKTEEASSAHSIGAGTGSLRIVEFLFYFLSSPVLIFFLSA